MSNAKSDQTTRATVGLLTYGGVDPAAHAVWAGVDDVLRARDMNLICLPGNPLRASEGFSAQANVLYDLASVERLDGIVLFGGVVGHYVTPQEVLELCRTYEPLPVANLSMPLEGVPTLLIDNYEGMRKAVEHLVVDHGYRKVAFVRGPEGHPEAEARYRAYRDVLEENGLPFDLHLVAPGDFAPHAGREAMSLLLDERGVEFEAIACANDQVAMEVLEVARERGLHVPGDLAVTGFDDRREAPFVIPPLTTVSQSWYDMGRRVTELLLDLMAGEEVPEVVFVSPHLVVRESCGCAAGEVARVVTATPRSTATREEILAELRGVVGKTPAGLGAGWAEGVLAAAEAALGGEPERFMGHLDDLLRAVTMAGAPVAPWQGVISVLRRHVLPPEGDAEALARMEDLWQQARVLIGEVVGRVQVRLRVAESERTQVMREVGQTLLSSVDVEELLRSLARQMPRLEIPRFFLALYEYAPMPLEGARLLFAYDDGVLSIPEELRLFPTRLLVPDPFLPADERFSMVVEPLYFRDEQLGYAFFDAEPWDAVLYDLLQEQISSALRETLLVEQVERRAAQIETASEVARAASRVRDPDVLIQRVVDLVRGRFDLYYVGLFLVDETGDQTGEPGRWAVLRAGTGEAGDRMMAEGHRLEVGGDSMIGTSVAEGQAQVALDVGDEAVRFENPLLPDTHSELALPLVSRGRVIGALSIQSSRRGAFSEDDIRILQTMASQLGIAIENARLLERTQRALSEMETTHRQYLRDSWAGYLESESTTRYEVERPGVQITFDDELLAAASRAARGETVVVEDPQGGGTALVAPIHLRGEVIGALHVEDDGARKWNEDDRAILAAVVDRLALVAESLRLLQETQERAGRERLIGELTARMRETLDVDTVLQTAAVEIRRSLGLHDVLIRLEGGDGRVEGETERKDAGE